MSIEIELIEEKDIEIIQSYEKEKLRLSIVDEAEREIHSWNAKWRKESLEYFVSLGWSFLAKKNEAIVGYFLAQPLLFFDGQTQSLWIEYVTAENQDIYDKLVEMGYKLSRDKHFQRVYFPVDEEIQNIKFGFKLDRWDVKMMKVKTTK